MHPNRLRLLGVDDATQAGMVAMIRAAEIWDESKGVKFCTYAYRCIDRAVEKAAEEEYTIKVPHHCFQRTQATVQDYSADMRRALACARLNTAVDLPCRPAPEPFEPPPGLRAALAQLCPRLRRLLLLRFARDWTLQRIADRFGVTKERVRQLERSALARLRALLIDPACV